MGFVVPSFLVVFWDLFELGADGPWGRGMDDGGRGCGRVGMNARNAGSRWVLGCGFVRLRMKREGRFGVVRRSGWDGDKRDEDAWRKGR